MNNVFEIIKEIIPILALVVSAVSLFVYTQRDKKSFLRININSNKLLFTVDLENIGPSPARIKEIKLQRSSAKTEPEPKPEEELSLMTLFGAKGYTPIDGSGKGSIPQGDDDVKFDWNVEGRMFSNLAGDVISGGGTKHHLFRCQASDVDSLKYLWETLKDYEMTITYYDVYGILFWWKRECKSHFRQDFDSFTAALGNKTEFSEKADMK